jgi:cytochrome c-type biogenesis protein CcmH/NrfF
MEPRKSGVTLGLWLFPIILLVVGVIVIVTSARKSELTQFEALPAPPEAPQKPAEDSFLAQVRADLDK